MTKTQSQRSFKQCTTGTVSSRQWKGTRRVVSRGDAGLASSTELHRVGSCPALAQEGQTFVPVSQRADTPQHAPVCIYWIIYHKGLKPWNCAFQPKSPFYCCRIGLGAWVFLWSLQKTCHSYSGHGTVKISQKQHLYEQKFKRRIREKINLNMY